MFERQVWANLSLLSRHRTSLSNFAWIILIKLSSHPNFPSFLSNRLVPLEQSPQFLDSSYCGQLVLSAYA